MEYNSICGVAIGGLFCGSHDERSSTPFKVMFIKCQVILLEESSYRGAQEPVKEKWKPMKERWITDRTNPYYMTDMVSLCLANEY